jgi:hypothetical protein
MILYDPELTPAEISAAARLLERTLRRRALPDYSPTERQVLAILAAYLSREQRIRGKKSRNADKLRVEDRIQKVNILLRWVVKQKYRDNPNSLQTVMEIVNWLDTACNIQATEPQVRRDIHTALKQGPLPKW